uniref:NADH-ubiquinone oxidoreductase chain 2 n=1 Tax=Prionospio sp. 7 MH-2023 TaxID=3059275 RepID=A0AAU6QGU3_9ANNE
MFQYPFMNLFLFTLMSSTLMAISSSHWLMIWMSLELNMISFIPILASSNWFQESEAALKYLLFQAFGSSLILMGMFAPSFSSLALFGLVAKLGAAPFHFWFPSVMKSASWPSAAILMTWQKIAPLMLLISSFSSHKEIMSLIGALGALIGGLGGMTQTHFRALLAYSSIGHMGWIIATASFSPFISLTYLMFYIIISIPIMWSCFITNIQSIKQTSTPNYVITTMFTLPCVLSLSGLPPFTGFIPKLLALSSMSSIILPLILVLGSLINLSYYLNFFFTLFMSQSSFKTNLYYAGAPFGMVVFGWLACAPMPMIFIALSLL